MLLFEFIVTGPPVSHQARNRVHLQRWKESVRAAAAQHWPSQQPPFSQALKIIVVYYHDGVVVRMDNDNLLKPIQDALIGLVYTDDRIITDTAVRKTDLNGSFRARWMSRVLAEGFIRGEEFLHIQIEEAPDHTELL